MEYFTRKNTLYCLLHNFIMKFCMSLVFILHIIYEVSQPRRGTGVNGGLYKVTQYFAENVHFFLPRTGRVGVVTHEMCHCYS